MISQTVYDQLADHVTECEQLNAIDTETTITFAKSADRVRVRTREGGIMRCLLFHPEFQVSGLGRYGGGDIDNVADLVDTDARIIAVRGTLPIGVLKIGERSRVCADNTDIFDPTGEW